MGFLRTISTTTAITTTAAAAALALNSLAPSSSSSSSYNYNFTKPLFNSSSSTLNRFGLMKTLAAPPSALHIDAKPAPPKHDAELPEVMTEFMVDMSCEGCVKAVKNKLQTVDGIKSIDVDLSNQVVRIFGSSPVKIMAEALEQTGRKARLIGQGSPGVLSRDVQLSTHRSMESKMVGFCTVVALLVILSAAIAFAAEATRVQESDVYIVENTCYYPSSPAFAFGIIAAVFTIATRFYISVTFGGCSCCRSDPNSMLISKLFYILSWVASVVAVALLLAAAGLNNKEDEEIDSYGHLTCYVVKPGIFASGAVLSLLSAIFGIVACVTLTSATQTITNTMDANVDLEKSPNYPQ